MLAAAHDKSNVVRSAAHKTLEGLRLEAHHITPSLRVDGQAAPSAKRPSKRARLAEGEDSAALSQGKAPLWFMHIRLDLLGCLNLVSPPFVDSCFVSEETIYRKCIRSIDFPLQFPALFYTYLADIYQAEGADRQSRSGLKIVL